MGAPNITFSAGGNKIGNQPGFDHITVTFQSDMPYQKFECRATKAGEDWGVGKGALIASFSQTPANTPRTFEIYDDYLLNGDGEYRISLFAQGANGSWNDNYYYIPVDSSCYIDKNGLPYLCAKQAAPAPAPTINYLAALQSNGSCSIDTGFYPNQDTRIVMDFSIQSGSALTTGIFGGRSAVNQDGIALWYMESNQVRSDYATGTQNMDFPGYDTRVTAISDKNVAIVDGEPYTHPATTFQSTGQLMLFDINTGGSPNKRRPSITCWRALVYDNGVLVRDYRPALDGDGVACFYEAINQEYVYTLEGAFTAIKESGIRVGVSASETSGMTDPFLTEYGALTVGGEAATYDGQIVSLEAEATQVEVKYTLTMDLQYARSVSVNGTVIGSVQDSGDSVSTTVTVTDGSNITVVFDM